MNLDDPDLEISAAKKQVSAWLKSNHPGSYVSSAQLADAFTRFLAHNTFLELRTQRNPSALVYEARWYDAGRQLADFPKPFCAESDADARVLACAVLLSLDRK